MKRIIIALFFAVASVSMVSAQVSYGVRGGLNYSTYKIGVQDASVIGNLGNKPSFYVGGLVNIPLSSVWSFQPELIYSYDGTRLSAKGDLVNIISEGGFSKDVSASINMHNINIPLMFKLQPSSSLAILAGPYVSYGVAVGVNFNDNVKNLIETELGIPADDIKGYAKDILNDNLNKLNVGLSFGVEYDFDCGLFIDARYNFGLLNSLKKDYKVAIDDLGFNMDGNYKDSFGIEPKMKYSSIQVGLGYKF